MAALFDIKNVSYPSTIKTNTDFKVTGDVTLFGLPFIALLWVGVTITYPKSWWQLLGAAETSSVAIAKLGKFSVDFPGGFTKEGDYQLNITAWLGPTFLESAGPLTSVTVTIPPFPNVSTYPQKTFTVAGEGVNPATQGLAFNMDNPTINPSTVEIGKQTVITLPVKNVGTNPQTFTVHLQITEMGWSDIANIGTVVGDQTFGPYTLQPGASQNVVFNWTSKGAATGKWIVASVLVNGELAPNTTPDNPEIFKQQFEVTSPVVSFQLLNPVIKPADVVSGQVTAITFDVVNNSTDAQAVKLHADITEMGATDVSPPGSIVDSYDNQATIQPGQHWNPVWNWTAKGATTGKWIVVSLKDASGNLTPNTGPNNPNIFKQEFQVLPVAGVVSYQLLNPTINPADVILGQTTQITFEVVNNGTAAQIVKLHAEVHEMGATSISSPGSQVGPSYDSAQHTIQPGEHWKPAWSWVAAGATTGKWLVVSLLDASGNLTPNTGPNNPNIFKQEFQVLPGGGAATLSASYSNGVCSFSFSGFQPNASVTLTVKQTGGYLTTTANSSGSGSGSFADSDPSGTYTLQATDSYGHSATASFTVTPPATAVTLTSLNITAQAAYGQTVTALLGFSYKGPAANIILEVSLGEKSAIGGAFTVESGMKWQQSKAVVESTSPTAMSGSVNITIPSGVPTKLYDVLSRVLDQNGNELASRIDSGMITIVSGGGGGVTGISFQVAVWGIPAFGSYDSWWAYYWDPGIGGFVSCGQWYSSSSKITFSNVQPGGYFAVFLANGSNVSPQYTSPTFQAVNGGSYTDDVQMGVIYG